MFDKIYHKIQQAPDVVLGFLTSGGLVSTPVWLTALTDVAQLIVLGVGILVGISSYRLNNARRRELEKGDDDE